MKTEAVIQDLDNQLSARSTETVSLKREDAKLILERVKHLEGVATALLRSMRESGEIKQIVLPYKAKP
jgi:hypothetical protein